jgi:hypothetical protein
MVLITKLFKDLHANGVSICNKLKLHVYCITGVRVKEISKVFLSNWSGKRDSNSRPQPWQGCALPLSYSRIKYDFNAIFR